MKGCKKMKIKSKEPLEIQIKREILNGMTFTDIEKCHSINRSKIVTVNSQITLEDVKNFKGNLTDCVSSDVKEKITTLLRNGKLPKWISQQSGYPVRIINEIAKEIYGETTATEKPVIENITPRLANKVKEPDTSVPVQVKTSKVKAESETEKKEMAEIFATDYKLGKTKKAIAEEYGVSPYIVSTYLKKYTNVSDEKISTKVIRHTTNTGGGDRTPKHNSLSRQQVEEVANLIMKGFGNTEIISMVNFSISSQMVCHIRCKNCYIEWTRDYNFPKAEVNRATFVGSKFTKETFDKTISMLMEGFSDREIASEIDVNPTLINNIRNHKSFKKMTKDMVFPEPNDKVFYAEVISNDTNEDTITVESENKPTVISTEHIEEPPVEKIIEKKSEPKPEEPIPTNNNETVTEEFDEDTYYSNIAKAVAADIRHIAAIVVSASGKTIISSARVEKGKRIDPVPIAMMKINSKLLKGAKIYVANGRTYMSAETIAEIGAILK